MKGRLTLVAFLVAGLILLSGCLDDFIDQDIIILDDAGDVLPAPIYGSLFLDGAHEAKANSVTVTDGTITLGNVGDTNFADQNYLVVNETGKFKIDFNFYELVNSPARVEVVGRYDGNPAHEVKIYAWDYVDGDWNAFTSDLKDFPSSGDDSTFFFDFLKPRENFVTADGNAAIRIEHISNSIPTNNMYVEKIIIEEVAVDFNVPGEFFQVSEMLIGEHNGVTIDENSITVNQAGIYEVIFDVSFSGSPENVVHILVFKNGVDTDIVGTIRSLGGEGDTGSAGFSGLLDLNAGDVIDLKAEAELGNTWISIKHVVLGLVRVRQVGDDVLGDDFVRNDVFNTFYPVSDANISSSGIWSSHCDNNSECTLTGTLNSNFDANVLDLNVGGTLIGNDTILNEVATAPANPPANSLRLYVEDINGFSFYSFLDSTGMKRKLVRDSVILVKNVRGSSIAANRIVYASGSEDKVPTIDLADASDVNKMPDICVTVESIADGAFGRCMQVGLLENVNTSAFSEGDVLYVSPITPGTPTTTVPVVPNLKQEVGTVLVSDLTDGAIQIVARSLLQTETGTINNFVVWQDLNVVGDATFDQNIQVDGNLNVDNATLFVDSNNNRVGIGTAIPSTILDVVAGSATDPVADAWDIHPSDRTTKNELGITSTGKLEELLELNVYDYTRKALATDEEALSAFGDLNGREPLQAEIDAKKAEIIAFKETMPKYTVQRVGIMIDDANIPSEILTFDLNGEISGVSMAGYVGYLHAALKEAGEKINELEERIEVLEK